MPASLSACRTGRFVRSTTSSTNASKASRGADAPAAVGETQDHLGRLALEGALRLLGQLEHLGPDLRWAAGGGQLGEDAVRQARVEVVAAEASVAVRREDFEDAARRRRMDTSNVPPPRS